MIIPFHKITIIPRELKAENALIEWAAIHKGKVFSKKSITALNNKFGFNRALLTKSCTHALELAAIISGIKNGDEVIMPSYGFVSIANAVALRGAKCIFVDIRPDTLNIDEQLIEAAITNKTKAIITINYGGVACNYDYIKKLCVAYNLILIEDNAQGINAFHNNIPLGTFGDFATISFDFLKNISCGEGGCLISNNPNFDNYLRLAYEFGTNRLDYFEGKTQNYEWKSLGSNNYLSEYIAEILLNQIENVNVITDKFLSIWNKYYQHLKPLEDKNALQLPVIPAECKHNGHIFYIKLKDKKERSGFIEYLKAKNITAQFHYSPLHLSEYGKSVGEFVGNDNYTVTESERILRLPIYYDMTAEEQEYVIENILTYFN